METSYVINVLILLIRLLSWAPNLSAYTSAGYIGCYEDKALERLDTENDLSNTEARCIQHCLSSGFRYAATQNTTCACGNQLRDEYPIAKKCYVECPGNRNEVCGGLSNQMSFYDIWETTTSTLAATSNTQITTTTATTRRAENEHRTYTEMYISIPATAVIVGITAVIALCIFFRRKGRKHDLSGGTDRVNQLDTVTDTEIQVTKDDDSVHIYDDCAEVYHSNSDYLTPFMDTTSSHDNRSSNSGYPTPFMDTTSSQDNRHSNSGYPTQLMDTTSSQDNRNSNSGYLIPLMVTTFSQDNRNSNSGSPTPLMNSTSSQDKRNSNSGNPSPLIDTTSSQDNRNSNSGYPIPLMETTSSQDNRSSNSEYMTPLMDTTSSQDIRSSNSGYLTLFMDTTSPHDNRSSNSGYPTPLMDTTSSQDNRSSNNGYLTPFIDTTSSRDNRNSDSGYPTPLMDTTLSKDNRNHDTQNKDSTYLHPVSSTSASQTGGENRHNPTIRDAVNAANMYESIDD